MCGGEFLSKLPEKSIGFLNQCGGNSREQDEPNMRDMGRAMFNPLLRDLYNV